MIHIVLTRGEDVKTECVDLLSSLPRQSVTWDMGARRSRIEDVDAGNVIGPFKLLGMCLNAQRRAPRAGAR